MDFVLLVASLSVSILRYGVGSQGGRKKERERDPIGSAEVLKTKLAQPAN